MSEELKDKMEQKEEELVKQPNQAETEEVVDKEEVNAEESAKEDLETEEEEKGSITEAIFGKSKAAKFKEEIGTLKNKNEELKDKYLRLFADFDNFKKRTAKEKLAFIQESGKEVILELLPILDDFERAINVADTAEEVDGVKEGMILIFNKLKSNFQSRGVKEMESTGADFDPEFHEALTEIPAPTKEQKGKVIDTVEKGYYLNDKIIRYAKVVVGK